MIVVRPSDDLNSPLVKQFYKGILQGFNINANPDNINIASYAGRGDFQIITGVGTTVDNYWDIGNPSLGNIAAAAIATTQMRSFYHGALKLTTRLQAFTAPTNMDHWLSTGPPSGLGHFLYKLRYGIAATDGLVTGSNGLVDIYDDTLFTFLRHRVNPGAGDSTSIIQYIFHGVRIDY